MIELVPSHELLLAGLGHNETHSGLFESVFLVLALIEWLVLSCLFMFVVNGGETRVAVVA